MMEGEGRNILQSPRVSLASGLWRIPCSCPCHSAADAHPMACICTSQLLPMRKPGRLGSCMLSNTGGLQALKGFGACTGAPST